MLARGPSRPLLVAALVFIVFILYYRNSGSTEIETTSPSKPIRPGAGQKDRPTPTKAAAEPILPTSTVPALPINKTDINYKKLASPDVEYQPDLDYYRVLRSRTSKTGKYIWVDFGGDDVYNVNLIPHFSIPDRWYVIGQHSEFRTDIDSSEQLICVARFTEDVLHCDEWPTPLPIAASILGRCEGKDAYTNMRRGPRDARAFHGLDGPYLMYGSQASWGCLGLWLQDLRYLIDGAPHPSTEAWFRGLTELHRPKPGVFEKNYFLFWDKDGVVHAHYDVWPKRSYSAVKHDGGPFQEFMSADGVDLAPKAREHDDECMDRLMPKLTPGAKREDESIHQATNSLSITMCERHDPSCTPNDDNTFIMQIFQYKTYYGAHGRYEPHVMLIKRTSPFEVHGISQKPYWYHGREAFTDETTARLFDANPDLERPKGHTEMIYTTSISWKDSSQTYHGYLDDEIFIGFGIEDTYAGMIDVLAKDLFQDMEYC